MSLAFLPLLLPGGGNQACKHASGSHGRLAEAGLQCIGGFCIFPVPRIRNSSGPGGGVEEPS